MLSILHFITLVVATLFAAATAALANWLLLRGTFQLMRPATVGRAQDKTASVIPMRVELVPGTVRVARAFAGRR
jgi:hypothetical protein